MPVLLQLLLNGRVYGCLAVHTCRYGHPDPGMAGHNAVVTGGLKHMG